MQIKVNISNEEHRNLVEQAKDEIREELTDKALLKYLENQSSMELKEFIRIFGLYRKAEALKDMRVKDLNKNEQFILALAWLCFEDVMY